MTRILDLQTTRIFGLHTRQRRARGARSARGQESLEGCSGKLGGLRRRAQPRHVEHALLAGRSRLLLLPLCQPRAVPQARIQLLLFCRRREQRLSTTERNHLAQRRKHQTPAPWCACTTPCPLPASWHTRHSSAPQTACPGPGTGPGSAAPGGPRRRGKTAGRIRPCPRCPHPALAAVHAGESALPAMVLRILVGVQGTGKCNIPAAAAAAFVLVQACQQRIVHGTAGVHRRGFQRVLHDPSKYLGTT